MNEIKQRLQQVQALICEAEKKFGRPGNSVTLLAVSKTWPLESIIAAAEAGQRCFGENYIQEAIEKIDAARSIPLATSLEWHFIGSIQSNKTRDIANRFDWVHSVDRLKIAQRLNEQRSEALPPLNICLQVNISGESSKSGVKAKDVIGLADAIAKLPRLKLRGLMAIPQALDGFEQQRAVFRQVRELQNNLIGQGLALDTLSMGMSNDLEAAIAEGATIVRVGTAIFGSRNYSTPA